MIFCREQKIGIIIAEEFDEKDHKMPVINCRIEIVE